MYMYAFTYICIYIYIHQDIYAHRERERFKICIYIYIHTCININVNIAMSEKSTTKQLQSHVYIWERDLYIYEYTCIHEQYACIPHKSWRLVLKNAPYKQSIFSWVWCSQQCPTKVYPAVFILHLESWLDKPWETFPNHPIFRMVFSHGETYQSTFSVNNFLNNLSVCYCPLTNCGRPSWKGG